MSAAEAVYSFTLMFFLLWVAQNEKNVKSKDVLVLVSESSGDDDDDTILYSQDISDDADGNMLPDTLSSGSETTDSGSDSLDVRFCAGKRQHRH